MKLVAALGRNKDIPVGPDINIANVAAGSAADSELPIAVLPDLTLSFSPSAVAGSGVLASGLARNDMQNRQIVVVPAAAAAANATNNFDWRVNLWRGGVLQGALAFLTTSVATTVAAAITATGVQSVTPASINGIVAGEQLVVDTGASQEQVVVLSVSGSAFTANFNKTHSGGFAVTTSLVKFLPASMTPAHGGVASGATLPAITAGSNVNVTPNAVNGLSGMYGIHVGDQLLVDTVASGKQETVTVTAVTATQFTATFAQSHSASAPVSTSSLGLSVTGAALAAVQQGDVMTLARVSNNTTGLASPAAVLFADWSIATSPMGE